MSFTPKSMYNLPDLRQGWLDFTTKYPPMGLPNLFEVKV